MEKIRSSATLSMTHEGFLFQDLRVLLGQSVSVYHCDYSVHLSTAQFVLCLWHSVPSLKDAKILNAFTNKSRVSFCPCRKYVGSTCINLDAKMLIFNQVTKHKLSLKVESTHWKLLLKGNYTYFCQLQKSAKSQISLWGMFWVYGYIFCSKGQYPKIQNKFFSSYL